MLKQINNKDKSYNKEEPFLSVKWAPADSGAEDNHLLENTAAHDSRAFQHCCPLEFHFQETDLKQQGYNEKIKL